MIVGAIGKGRRGRRPGRVEELRMANLRQHAVFVGVVGVVAALVVLVGPEAPVTVGAVFGALGLLHLAWMAGGRAAELPETGGLASSRRSGTGAGKAAARGKSPPVSSSSDARVSTPPQSGGSNGTGDHGSAPAERSDGPSRDDRTAEESMWLRQQLTDDVDDIAFLPPYASGEVEPSEPALQQPRVDWREFLEDDPSEVGSQRVTDTSRNVPIPRHFALGTVAIIRGALSPAEVAKVLLEQRRQPRKQFGEVAVEMGVLDETVLRELLVAQGEGLFTDEEIRDARQKLREYRDREQES